MTAAQRYAQLQVRSGAPMLLALVLLLGLGLGLAACQQTQQATVAKAKSVKAIVLITIGGLRSDVVLADAAANPQPLSTMMSEALVFDRAYAPSSLPVQSLASLAVGRLPTRGGAIGVTEAQPAAEAVTLATRFRRLGWATAWVAQKPWGARPGFTRGFDLVETAREQPLLDTELTDRALRSLRDLRGWDGSTGFFLAVHYSGPASPADPSSSTDSVAARADYLERLLPTLNEAARLIEALEEDTLVVLAGASGYELFEHGGLGFGWTVYEEAVRVPLVMRMPSLLAPSHIESPVSLVDLTPTLLDLAGAPLDNQGALDSKPAFDGEPLLELRGGRVAPKPSNTPRLAEVVVLERAISRAVIGERFKYVRTSRTAPPKERAAVERGIEELQAAMLSGAIETPPLFGEALYESMFDLEKDPREQTSILGQSTAHLAELKAVLRSYRRRYEESAYSPTEITRRLEIDPEQVRDLEALGYL